MPHSNIKQLVIGKRFLEALYFGTIELVTKPSPDLHLCLGIACCGSIKPIAQVERELRAEVSSEQWGPSNGELIIGRDTTIVNEGLHHLIRAISLENSIYFPSEWDAIVEEVCHDLRYYILQEFHGYPKRIGYSLRTAGLASIVLLCKLRQKEPSFLNESQKKVAGNLLEQLFSHQSDQTCQAEFYILGDADK